MSALDWGSSSSSPPATSPRAFVAPRRLAHGGAYASGPRLEVLVDVAAPSSSRSPRSQRTELQQRPRSSSSTLDWTIELAGVTPKASAEFAMLRGRWGALEKWPSFSKVAPQIHAQIDSWTAFKNAWERGDEDTTALQAQSGDLEVAENTSSSYGYPGAYHAFTQPSATRNYGTENKLSTPGVEEQTDFLGLADTVDKISGGGPPSPKVPPWKKAIGLVIVGGVLAGAAVVGVKLFAR